MAGRLPKRLLHFSSLLALARALSPRSGRAAPEEHQGSLGIASVSLEQTRSSLAHQRQGPCSAEAVCVEFHDRLGNNLYQLERALWLAHELHFCFLAVPVPVSKEPISALVATPEDGVVRLRPDAPNLSRAEIIERCSVSCLECAPRRRAAVTHLRVCSDWGPCDIGKRALARPTIQMLRNTMQESIVPSGLLRCDPASAQLPADALVIHMRSGDSLEARSGFYPQPPCAYYAAVMRHGNGGRSFPSAVIVTEPDLRHPCIQALKTSFPNRVRVQSRSVTEDACTVASARHLAISFGTWGPALSRLNSELRSLHVPFGEDNVTADEYGGSLARMARHWFHQAVYEGEMPYEQHVYSFPGYRCEWDSKSDHFAKMLRYGESRVVARTIPGRASKSEP